MVAGGELADQRGVDGGHAGGCGEGVLRPFERGDTFLKHADGRVAIAGVNEAVRLAVEPRLRRFGVRVGEALREVERLRQLAMTASVGAGVHHAGAGGEGFLHGRVLRHFGAP